MSSLKTPEILQKLLNYNKYHKVKKQFKKLGIKVYGIYGLNIKTWEVIYKCLFDLNTLYPIVNNNMSWIRVENKKYFILQKMEKDTLASAGFYVINFIMPFVNISRRLGIVLNKEELEKSGVIERVGIKIVDNNTFIYGIISHEFGHLSDLVISGYDPEEYKGLRTFKWINKRYSKCISNTIVDNALNKLFGENEHDIEIIINQIGEYASKNRGEIFAEAVAMHYCGLDTKLSLIIINELNSLHKNI